MVSEVNAMLLQFRVKNYRSIGDEIIIDLTAGKGRELQNFCIEKNKVKILPIISFYGNNASGKSNIIDAMLCMFESVMDSHRYNEKYGLLTTPFFYDTTMRNTPTEFEVFFTIDRYEYQYGFATTSEKVHEEWLYRKMLSTNNTALKVIFEREHENIQFASSYKDFENLTGLIGEKNLALSFLAFQKNRKAKIFQNIHNWMQGVVASSNVALRKEEDYAEFYEQFDYLKSAFLEFIHEFDPLLEDIKIVEEMNRDGEFQFRIITKHNGEWYPLDIESQGTQKLFSIFISLHISLKMAPTLFICDELDASIHPLILRRIVSMFHDKEQNKMGSQLIFTAHNTIMLDRHELRRDEIWFVEKDERGYTTTYSLDSFKSSDKQIRSDMSYGKHYLSGRFGAIPYANSGVN